MTSYRELFELILERFDRNCVWGTVYHRVGLKSNNISHPNAQFCIAGFQL